MLIAAALMLGASEAPSQTGQFAGPAASPDRTAIDPDFRLGPGDLLAISVLEDPTLDRQVLIRPDGRISMPLAGSPMAAGRTPEELATALRRTLADDFIQPPTVTVAVAALASDDETEEADLPVIYVLGEVNNPGSFTVQGPVGLLQALSLAGGPGIFAAKKRVQIRQRAEDGVERVIVVNYKALEDGAPAPDIRLGNGDTIVVPERGLFE